MTQRVRFGFLLVLTVLAAPSALAFLDVNVTSTSDLSAIEVGESFTLDIEVEETLGGGAFALGFRAANYDPTVIGFQNAVVPAVIFEFSPAGPPPSFVNTALGDEQPPAAGIRPGWSVNLFQGVSASPSASGGPEQFQVTFSGLAPGLTQVDVGAFLDYLDVYAGPECISVGSPGCHPAASVTIRVVPAPRAALLIGLGLTGLALGRSRPQPRSAVS